MDFVRICTKTNKDNTEVFPDFVVKRSKDLMIQGTHVYAVWDEKNNMWSTDEYDVQRLVDEELSAEASKYEEKTGVQPTVKYLSSSTSGMWSRFKMISTSTPA